MEVKSADKKPEKYIGPDGKPRVRMVPVDKQVIKKESAVDEVSLSTIKKAVTSSGLKNVKKAQPTNKLKKDLEAMKLRLATEGTLSEATDMNKLKQLAAAGLVQKTDVQKLLRVFAKMESGKTITPAEREMLLSVLSDLTSLITGDMSMLQKAKKAVKEEAKLDEGILKPYHAAAKQPWSKTVKDSKGTAGEYKQIGKGKDFTVHTAYRGSNKSQPHYVVRDDKIIGSGMTFNSALKDAKLKDKDVTHRSKFAAGSILNKGMKEEVELEEVKRGRSTMRRLKDIRKDAENFKLKRTKKEEAYRKPTQAEIDADKKKENAGKKRPSMDYKSVKKSVYKNMMGGLKKEDYKSEYAHHTQGLKDAKADMKAAKTNSDMVKAMNKKAHHSKALSKMNRMESVEEARTSSQLAIRDTNKRFDRAKKTAKKDDDNSKYRTSKSGNVFVGLKKEEVEYVNEMGPRHTSKPMKSRFGGAVDSKKFDAYKKFVKQRNVDEPTVRMVIDNPNDAESKRMMKNANIAKAVELRKAAMKESISEKLSVSDGMGAWIDDFKKSDAPQFKGKNDKERKDMAIAAYLSAKKGEKQEGYVSMAQQRAVWATRKDGGKGHPDNKGKKKK